MQPSTQSVTVHHVLKFKNCHKAIKGDNREGTLSHCYTLCIFGSAAHAVTFESSLGLGGEFLCRTFD